MYSSLLSKNQTITLCSGKFPQLFKLTCLQSFFDSYSLKSFQNEQTLQASNIYISFCYSGSTHALGLKLLFSLFWAFNVLHHEYAFCELQDISRVNVIIENVHNICTFKQYRSGPQRINCSFDATIVLHSFDTVIV